MVISQNMLKNFISPEKNIKDITLQHITEVESFKNFDNDPKPPKSSPPAVAEPDEDEKEKKLQESIKRIARAKRVTLNGKRIK